MLLHILLMTGFDSWDSDGRMFVEAIALADVGQVTSKTHATRMPW